MDISISLHALWLGKTLSLHLHAELMAKMFAADSGRLISLEYGVEHWTRHWWSTDLSTWTGNLEVIMLYSDDCSYTKPVKHCIAEFDESHWRVSDKNSMWFGISLKGLVLVHSHSQDDWSISTENVSGGLVFFWLMRLRCCMLTDPISKDNRPEMPFCTKLLGLVIMIL